MNEWIQLSLWNLPLKRSNCATELFIWSKLTCLYSLNKASEKNNIAAVRVLFCTTLFLWPTFGCFVLLLVLLWSFGDHFLSFVCVLNLMNKIEDKLINCSANVGLEREWIQLLCFALLSLFLVLFFSFKCYFCKIKIK